LVGWVAGAAARGEEGGGLIVPAVFDLAQLFPVKDNAIRGEDLEVSGDEAGLKESLAGNLSFAEAGVGVNTPGDFACGDVFVSGDFGGHALSVDEIDPDDLFEVAVVVADPLSGEVGGAGGVWGGGGQGGWVKV